MVQVVYPSSGGNETVYDWRVADIGAIVAMAGSLTAADVGKVFWVEDIQTALMLDVYPLGGGSLKPLTPMIETISSGIDGGGPYIQLNYTNGTNYKANVPDMFPVAASTVLYSAAPGDSLTGTTAKTLMRTINIDTSKLGNTGRLRIAIGSTNTNNANSKTTTVALWDGTTEVDLTAIGSTTLGKTVQKSVYLTSRTSQWFNGSASAAESSSAATPGTATLDLDSGTCELRIYGTLANSGDTMTVTRAHVSAHYGA